MLFYILIFELSNFYVLPPKYGILNTCISAKFDHGRSTLKRDSRGLKIEEDSRF